MAAMNPQRERLLLQGTFDVVAAHLMRQGKRAVYTAEGLAEKQDDHDCVYWDVDTDRRCAIGCLIAPKHYDPKCEGAQLLDESQWWTLDSVGRIGAPPARALTTSLLRSGVVLTAGTVKLLEDLQDLHDAVPTTAWPRGLADRAASRGLYFDLDAARAYQAEHWETP